MLKGQKKVSEKELKPKVKAGGKAPAKVEAKKGTDAKTKETPMAKATPQKSAAPVSLGTKRSCPKCGTKFYDFNKSELNCPKCEATLNVAELSSLPKMPEPKKAPKKEIPEEALMESDDLVVGEANSEFESLEDLEDDEDDVVEDIASDEEDAGDDR